MTVLGGCDRAEVRWASGVGAIDEMTVLRFADALKNAMLERVLARHVSSSCCTLSRTILMPPWFLEHAMYR
jgi:hypothetical protein